jgi:gluconate 2-dehydrogenase gamma chain
MRGATSEEPAVMADEARGGRVVRTRGPTRREVIVAVASAGLATAATLLARRPGALLRGAAAATSAPPALPSAPTSLQSLTSAEYTTLTAIVERIYPRDDTPGAVDLGVPEFIDRALAGSSLPAWSDGLLTGLARLELESFRRFAVGFADARPVDQDALVATWAGERGADDARWIKRLTTATIEGVLTDPIHGGNRDAGGWRTFGLRADPFSPSERGKR